MTRRLVVLAAAVAALGVACGTDGPTIEQVARKKVEPLETAAIPASMLGLAVTREDMSESLEKARPSYVGATALYSLRRDDLLLATLQVSEMRKEADYTSTGFRRAVVNQIGSSAPKAFRMGTTTVWLTTGTKQKISVWFKDRWMFVLASREDFDQPRTLLREALEIEPA